MLNFFSTDDMNYPHSFSRLLIRGREMNKNKIILNLLSLLFLVSCMTPKPLDPNKPLIADSKELTRQELEMAAIKIGNEIVVNFNRKPNPNGVAVAILQTKNETSEQIPVNLFEETLVATLLKGKIFTIRTDKRVEQLKEIEWSLKTGGKLSAANLKYPNYFVRTTISETQFRSDGTWYIEQILNLELQSIEGGEIAFSSKDVYRKKTDKGKTLSW